ncbi:hypothetical protein ACLB2K_002440 [Fragaria x ananassa]
MSSVRWSEEEVMFDGGGQSSGCWMNACGGGRRHLVVALESEQGREAHSVVTPPSNWVKINFDGFVRSKAAAGGFILRTEAGKPLVATAFNSGVASIPLVEALVLRNSLVCAKEKGLSKIEIEDDSNLVTDIANGVCDPPWRLLKIFQDIKSLRCNFVSISFKRVLREANFVANVLANIGHRVENCHFWEECVPPKASLALIFDNVNFGF